MEPHRHAHGEVSEPWLESWLAVMRYRSTLRTLEALASQRGGLQGLDYGCGYHGHFVQRANRIPGVRFRGCDLSVSADCPELFSLRGQSLDTLSPRPDVITAHAVLEHLDDPRAAVEQFARLLSADGILILTVPSIRARPVLEFLAFRLGVISRTEIEDHKRYYDRAGLEALLSGLFSQMRHRYFQFGLNNRVEAFRSPAAA